MEQFEIQDSRAQLVVVPALGAGIVRYEASRKDGTSVPLLRSWNASAGAVPFSLACNPLLPWSNRISGGGFSYQGRFHPLEPNLQGQKYPLHGNGFQVPWTIESSVPSSDSGSVRLAEAGLAPLGEKFRAFLAK